MTGQGKAKHLSCLSLATWQSQPAESLKKRTKANKIKQEKFLRIEGAGCFRQDIEPLAVSQRIGMLAPAADHTVEKKTYHSNSQLEEM